MLFFEKQAQSKKVFDGEARKAYFQQARIRIAEHRARMEQRARNVSSIFKSYHTLFFLFIYYIYYDLIAIVLLLFYVVLFRYLAF